MDFEDYPPQAPMSPAGQSLADAAMVRGEGLEGIEIAYGADPYQGISLHVPHHPNGAVLGFMHGGGWTSGYKELMNFIAPAFNRAGVIFASIGYRLAPEHLFPAGMDDVATGIAWLHGNIADHGGDPARIFLGGHSAGAHYAALLAVRTDWQVPFGVPETVIQGCLPISGAYRIGAESGMKTRPLFLGAEGNEQAASPLFNVHAAPPFLIAHGSDDFPHLITQARELEMLLQAENGDVGRLVLEGCDHFSACLRAGDADGPWAAPALEWIAAH